MPKIVKLSVTTFACCLFCTLNIALALAAEKAAPGTITELPGYTMDDLRNIADNQLTKTGAGLDTTAPLNRPLFLSVSDASLSMDDREPVFVVHYPNGLTRVYPQRILVWHEILNDVLPDPRTGSFTAGRTEETGETYTITYSPLTGCVTGFKSMAGRYPSTFGNEGRLLNANTILYDRATGNIWSQLLAVSLEGPLRGKRLNRIPVYWMRWGGVKKRYPQAEVLSRSTGFKRNYGKDPYGSYIYGGTYYDNTQLPGIIPKVSNKLPPKKRILGLEIGNMYGALVIDGVRAEKVLNQSLGVNKIVALYDEELDRVMVFERQLDDENLLDFMLFENKYIDTKTRSEWNSEGECTYGRLRGRKLKPVLAIDAMWFAWYVFHPDTKILDREVGEFSRPKGPDIPYL